MTHQDTTDVGTATPSGARIAAGHVPGFMPEPGDRIGRYVVREQIAEGGMGMILTADDPELGRVVAIKLLHPELSSPSQEQQQRLQREAQAMAKVSHANLVTVFDVGTHEGQVFVAMEYVAGVTLRQWLGPKRDWRDIVDMFCAAGRGLAAAHKAGLVHRDFKPANVLVGDDGVPQVLDFGLVRRAGEVDPADPDDDEPLPREDTLSLDLTRTGSVMGTPAYMAPEQHMGEPTDARSDQFAFCVALYEALYEERPFPGEDAGRVTMAVLENERRPKPASTDVPEAVYRILDRGLSRDPDDRYPSMEPLLEALAQEVLRARAPAAPAPSKRWPLVVGFLAVAGAAGVIATMQDDEPAPPPVLEPAQPTASPAAMERERGSSAAPELPRETPITSPAPEPGVAPTDPVAGNAGPEGAKPTEDGLQAPQAPKQDPGTALPGVEEEPLPPPEHEPKPKPEPEPELPGAHEDPADAG